MEVEEYLFGSSGRIERIKFKDVKEEAKVPFHISLSLEDFSNDGTRYFEYLEGLRNEFERQFQEALPGEPLRAHFPDTDAGERQYQSRLRMFELEQVGERLHEKHKPVPQREPLDPDFRALGSKNKKDKEVAFQQINDRNFIADELRKESEYRALGRIKEADACRERAAMAQRQANKVRQSHKYEHEKAAEKFLIETVASRLEEIANDPEMIARLTPEQREDLELKIAAWNHESNEEYSYVLDHHSGYNSSRNGNRGLLKIDHPGVPASKVSQKAKDHNMDYLDYLINKEGVGVEVQKKEEEAQGGQTEDPYATMSQAQFEKMREEEGAKRF